MIPLDTYRSTIGIFNLRLYLSFNKFYLNTCPRKNTTDFNSFPSTPFIKNGFLRKAILNLVETNAKYSNKPSCDTTRKAFPIHIRPFENLGIPGEGWWCCLNLLLTKKTSSIFGDRFRSQFLIDKCGVGPKPLMFVSPEVEQINLWKSHKNSDLKQKLISPDPRYE